MVRPKTLAILVLTVLILGIAFLLYAPSLTGDDYLKDFFLQQLERSLGHKISVHRVKFVIFPRLRLELTDVTIHDRDPAQVLLSAKRIDFVLRLIPLLRKQLVGKRLFVEEPHLFLRRDRTGQWNVTSSETTSDESPLEIMRRMFRIREAAILDGKISLTDEAHPDGPRTVHLHNLDTSIKIQPEQNQADLHLSMTTPNPKGVTAFSVTGSLSQADVPASFAPEGLPAVAAGLQFEGSVDTANLHLRDLASFFGPHPIPAEIQGAANFRGHVRLLPGVAGYDVVLSNVTANLEGVKLQGKASLAGLLTPEPTFSLTVSSSPVELTDLLTHIPAEWIHPQLPAIIAERRISGLVEVKTATLTGSAGAASPLSLTGEFNVRNGNALIGSDRVPTQNLAGTAFVEAGRIRIVSITGTYGAIQISEGKAMVLFLDAGPWLELEISGTMTATDLMPFLAKTIQSDRLSKFFAESRDVEGVAHPTFRLVGPLNQPGGVTFVGGEITTRHVSLLTPALPERITGLQGRFVLSQGGAQLDQVMGHVGDSEFRLHGTVTGGSSSAFQDFQVRVHGDAAHLIRFLPAHAISPETVQGPVTAAAILTGSTSTPHARGTVLFTDAKVVVGGAEKPSGAPATVEFEGEMPSAGGVTLSRLELFLPSARLTSKGKIQLGQRFSIDATLATGTVSLSALPEWITKGGFEAGNLEISLDVKATERDWKTWRFTGWVALTNGLMLAKEVNGHIQDLYLRAKLVRNGAEIKGLSFRLKDSDISMTGTVKNWTTKPTIVAKIDSNQMDIDLLIPKGERAPIRDLLEMLAATSRVTATASIGRGVYKKLRFGGLSCRITIEDGVLDVDRIVGQSDTGQVAGRFVVQLPQNAPADAEASVRMAGLHFEDLLPLLGTRDQWMTGETTLSGTLRGHGKNPHGILPTLGGKAHFVIEDGRMFKNEKRPTWKIISILNLPAVLQGKVDLDKEGLAFTKITGTLTIRNGLMESEDIVLDSPVLKITAAGNYDLPTDQLDMVWAVSPFGSYSQFLKTIPLFGRLFAGDRKGIATALFQVKGSIEDPEVTYLPMKSFATGLTGLAQLAFDVLKNTLTMPVDLLTPKEKEEKAPAPEEVTPAEQSATPAP